MILARSDSIVEGFWSEEVVKRGASERISVPGGMVVLAMSPLPLLGMSERVKRADSAGGVVVEVVVEGDMLVAVVVFLWYYEYTLLLLETHTKKKSSSLADGIRQRQAIGFSKAHWVPVKFSLFFPQSVVSVSDCQSGSQVVRVVKIVLGRK